MATIDPSIALSIKPIQIQDPLNRMAAMMQIEGGQQSQQLNALQMRKAQQEFDTQNRLGKAWQGSINPETGDIDYNRLLQNLSQDEIGATAIPGIIKQRTDASQAAANLSAKQFETQKKIQDLTAQMKRDLSRSPTNANIEAHFEDFVSSKLFNPQQIAAAKATRDQLLAMPLADRQPYLSSMGATASDLKPVIQNMDVGGSIIPRVLDAYSGLPISEQTPIKKTVTPGELLVNQREQQRINLGERRDIVASTSTAADGTITQFNKFGDVINRITAAGKPSATFEKAANVKAELQKNISTTITEIRDAIKPGGLLEKSTASGAGKLLDAAGNFVGYATEGSIAAASLAPIADMALKMVPRFEGPQSDKDTASYKQAAGELANSALPVATRKAAAKTIIRIMENRKNQFTTESMINEGISSGGPALPPGFTVDK
jgi:hypothetical protein